MRHTGTVTRVRSLDFDQLVYMAQFALRNVRHEEGGLYHPEIDWVVGRLQEAFPLTPPAIVGRASNYLSDIHEPKERKVEK